MSAAEESPIRRRRGGLLELMQILIPARRNRWHQYVIVTLLMAFALMARLLIAPLDGGIQYVTFFPTVAIAAVIGGLWPGLYTALLSVILATYLFWPPYGEMIFTFRYETILSNLVFLIDAVLVCSSIEAMHRFYRKFVDAEDELRLASSVFEHSGEGIMVTDASSIIISVNPAFSDITGYSAADAVGRNASLLRSQRHDSVFYRTMWNDLKRNGCWRGEIWNRRKDGELYLEWLTINRVTDEKGAPIRYVGVFHDITERHLKDEYIRHLAFHDPLTRLPNRLILEDRLQHAMVRAQREKERLALLFVDLDQFKAINDGFGHGIGDLLLQEVAARIQGLLRASDTVVRLGGDEFLILMEGVRSEAHYRDLAGLLVAELSRPMHIDAHILQIGASVGVAIFPDDADDADALIQCADAAMYAAKSAGATHRCSTPR